MNWEIIQKLLITDNNAQEIRISLYCPLDNQNRDEAKQHIKSQLLSTVHRSELINQHEIIHRYLRRIEFYIDSLITVEKGFAIFLKIHPTADIHASLTELDENITIHSLYIEPNPQSHVGKTFVLDQLFLNLQHPEKFLILKIDQELATAYQVNRNTINQLHTLSNPYETEPKPYLETSGAPNQSAIHGNAQNILQRSIQEENRHFLKQIQQWLLRFITQQKNINHVILFHSQPYQEFIDQMLTLPEFKSQNIHLIPINQQPITEQDLLKQAHSILNQQIKQVRAQSLHQAENKYHTFVKDWQSTTEAAQQHRIDTLFIHAQAQKPGYVTPDEQVTLTPRKHARPTTNITPWLIHSVTTAGGKIIVFPHGELPQPQIAAKLRY